MLVTLTNRMYDWFWKPDSDKKYAQQMKLVTTSAGYTHYISNVEGLGGSSNSATFLDRYSDGETFVKSKLSGMQLVISGSTVFNGVDQIKAIVDLKSQLPTDYSGGLVFSTNNVDFQKPAYLPCVPMQWSIEVVNEYLIKWSVSVRSGETNVTYGVPKPYRSGYGVPYYTNMGWRKAGATSSTSAQPLNVSYTDTSGILYDWVAFVAGPITSITVKQNSVTNTYDSSTGFSPAPTNGNFLLFPGSVPLDRTNSTFEDGTPIKTSGFAIDKLSRGTMSKKTSGDNNTVNITLANATNLELYVNEVYL